MADKDTGLEFCAAVLAVRRVNRVLGLTVRAEALALESTGDCEGLRRPSVQVELVAALALVP